MKFYAPLVTAIVTYLMMHLLISSKFSKFAQDIPNTRSLHNSPVPRTGGLGMMVGVMCGWAMLYGALVWWILIPLLVLFAISLLDDMYNLPVQKRLLIQLFAAGLMVGGSEVMELQSVVIVVVLFFAVWMINLYNFMDGINGLAGGMALFGFGIYGIAAFWANNTSLALLNFCIAISAASFLYFNFHPARIFMGDSGSITLGFLSVAMGLWGWQQGAWLPWFPLLVFSPFIIDASVTLVKRTFSGLRVTEAHRDHYYQRLVRLGWGHRKVAIAEYGLMLAAGLSALLVLNNSLPWQVLFAWGIVYIGIMFLVDMRWKKYKNEKNV
jgi:UDP-N-acetylmuramyl pentapeptide phosphotransferase/UDP-N-acetylglucosamine-1-phosphate transferase